MDARAHVYMYIRVYFHDGGPFVSFKTEIDLSLVHPCASLAGLTLEGAIDARHKLAASRWLVHRTTLRGYISGREA